MAVVNFSHQDNTSEVGLNRDLKEGNGTRGGSQRKAKLEDLKRRAAAVQAKSATSQYIGSDAVNYGDVVSLEYIGGEYNGDIDTFTIVRTEEEHKPSEGLFYVGYPVGRALIGAKLGQKVIWEQKGKDDALMVFNGEIIVIEKEAIKKR